MLVLITLKPQFNEADPERYKAGFDGGVDFILLKPSIEMYVSIFNVNVIKNH